MFGRIVLCAALLVAPATAFMTGPVMPLRSTRAAGAVNAGKQESTPQPYKPTFGLSKPFLEGNEVAEEVFTFLQRQDYVKEREGFLMGEIFADKIIREGGFTEFAETLNGRIAQVAFPLGLSATFDGDILNQLAEHPIKAIALCFVIAFASLPPVFEENEKDRRAASLMRVVVPPGLNKGIMDVYNTFELGKIFTKEAERTNGRAAMAAFAFWLFTAILF